MSEVNTAFLRIRYGVDLSTVYNGYFDPVSQMKRTQEMLEILEEYNQTGKNRKDAQTTIKKLRQNYRVEVLVNQATCILKAFLLLLETELKERLTKYQNSEVIESRS